MTKNQLIIKKLIKKKISISTAESCTGGMLASVITSVPGSSQIFKLGLITYSNKSKVRILRISNKVLKNYGAVSKEVCLRMVKKINNLYKTKISISITGVAGPGGGTSKKPVGLVYIGILKGKKISINKLLFKNKGRQYIQKMSVNTSLKLISNFIK